MHAMENQRLLMYIVSFGPRAKKKQPDCRTFLTLGYLKPVHMSKQIKKTDTGEESTPKKIYGDPEFGPEEDIFNRAKKESLGDDAPEGDEDIDLDVPGSELDDDDEKIGEEDEENNYYSLGGDDHNNLKEDQGDND